MTWRTERGPVYKPTRSTAWTGQIEDSYKEQRMPALQHRTGPRIVAGGGGSPSGPPALRWAIRQAGLTGATVDAVITWHYPVSAGGYGWGPMGTGTAFDFKENAEKVLADAIGKVCDPGSDIPVRARVVEGNAAQVLLD